MLSRRRLKGIPAYCKDFNYKRTTKKQIKRRRTYKDLKRERKKERVISKHTFSLSIRRKFNTESAYSI